MKRSWSSRDRLLAAINNQEPDYVPLWNLWTRRKLSNVTWETIPQRVEAVLDLGMDDTVLLDAPGIRQIGDTSADRLSSDVQVRRAKQLSPQQPYPMLTKEYETPKGTLRVVSKQTEDWPHGDDVPIFSDHAVSRSTEFLVKSAADLEKLAYIFTAPTAEQINEFWQEAKVLKSFANRKGVLMEGGWIAVADAAVWLCGVQPLLTAAMDDPEYVQALLNFLYDWQEPRIELLLEAGVDVISHRGWYETTRFWSPRLWRQMIKPLLKKEIDLTHAAGKKFLYIHTAGTAPLLDDILELGVDVLWGVDPVQGDADLQLFKRKLGGKVCIWGGMNSAVTLEMGTREEIRQAVTDAIRICGPGGGFVLFPVDQIFEWTPWESVEIMLKRWKEIRDYPLGSFD